MKELLEKLATEQTPNNFPRRDLQVPLPVEAHYLNDEQRDTLTQIILTIVSTLLGIVFRKR